VDNLLIQLGLLAGATVSGIAAIFAAKAERNSRPVANGFTDEVLGDLREVRKMLFEHLKEHDRRDIKNENCVCCAVTGTTRKRKKVSASVQDN
jgi:hypothetical protein